MAELAAPLFQRYVAPPDAVSVALFPQAMVTLPAALAIGFGYVTTFMAADFVHPFASVTVQV